MIRCPVCGRDMEDKTPHQKAKELLSGQVVSQRLSPGGRELCLKNGACIQLSEYCDWCDYEKIKRYFND